MKYLDEGEKKITLMYILKLIEDHIDAENLCWSILFLDVIGYSYDPYMITILSASELEKAVKITRGGYKIKWEELKKICSGFENIVDCSIVGSRSYEEINHIAEKCTGNNFDANFEMNYIGIDIVDGEMYKFYSKDQQLEQKICNSIGPFPVIIYGNI
jgi:hypothetical protein